MNAHPSAFSRRLATGVSVGCLALGFTLGTAGVLYAQESAERTDSSETVAGSGRVALSVESTAVMALSAEAAAPAQNPGLGGGQLAPAIMGTQTMLWASRRSGGGRFMVGVGTEHSTRVSALRAAEGSAAVATDSAVLVGVGVNLGQPGSHQPRLTWQTPIASTSSATSSTESASGEAAAPKMRVGLTFAKHDQFAALRRAGALKLELTSTTTLALRPRRGKFSVTLMSQW